MASTTISLSIEAYNLLKKAKGPGESFSDVILSSFRPPATTGVEMLERLEKIKGPLIDRELMGKVRSGRGRPSKRRKARVRR